MEPMYVCSGTNPRKCQDLGDSILLLLGSFILLNVGLNVVTLLWRNLKGSLRILVRHFFCQDKEPSRPAGTHCTADPKALCSRVSSRVHCHTSNLLRRTNHRDSWIPDGEKASRCCRMPPQCGQARVPSEAPGRLGKEGAGEAPQVTALKDRASLLSRTENSSQVRKMNKLNMVSLSLPQESKTKAPDHGLTRAAPKAKSYPSAHTSTVHIPPPMPPPTPEPIPTHVLPPAPPPSPIHASTSAPTLADSQAQAPDLAPAPICASTPTPAPAPAPEHTPEQSLPHNCENIPAHTTPQVGWDETLTSAHSKGHDPVHTSTQACTHTQGHIPKHTSAPNSGHSLAGSHLTHSCAHASVPAPSSTLAPPPTFVPAPPNISHIQAPVPGCPLTSTPAGTVPATTSTSVITLIPPPLAAFSPSYSTGHVVYDARRVKQNILHKCNAQNSGYSRRDLGTLPKPQERHIPVSPSISEQTSKQNMAESAEPSVESIAGYLELGNMEWKASEDTKEKLWQTKTFPYYSFHPCNSERKNTSSKASVYPKFLIYTQDAAPSTHCLHSPATAQSSLPTPTPSCTLSLPLVSPKAFVLTQSTNHQKPSNVTQPPSFLPTTKSSQSVPSSHIPNPPQLSAIFQSLIQPQRPELGDNQDLTQYADLQMTPCLSKDLRVSRNPSPTQHPGLNKNISLTQDPGLYKNPHLAQNLGLQKFPGLSQDPEHCKNLSPSQDTGLHKNPSTGSQKSPGPSQNASVIRIPCLTQPSGLQNNTLFTQTSNLQKTSDFIQDSGVSRNAQLIQDTVANKSQGLSQVTDLQKGPGPCQDSGGNKNTGNIQDPGAHGSIGFMQESRTQKNPPCPIQNTEVNKNSGLIQESGNCRNPDLVQTSGLHKVSGLTQDSGDCKNLSHTGVNRIPGFIQNSDCHMSTTVPQATEVEKANLTQDVGAFRSTEHGQDSNLHKCSGIRQDPGPHKDLAVGQNSSLPKIPGLSEKFGLHKDACHIPDPGLHENPSLAIGTGSVQVLDLHPTPQPTPCLMKCETTLEKVSAEHHVSWASVPNNQNSCPAKAQLISTDLQTFSEVPVLIELQPSSQQAGSQDWVYHPVDTVPSPCQNYHQVSVPPRVNWRPHCPGPGTRTGHVVFDARKRHLAVGRDKCEALSPRPLRQKAPRNSEENIKEWGYQNVIRTSGQQGTHVHQ
ncbi:uncharacterized protein SPEM3 [Cavia porcellus]|uniref:uncharacterized protein SPEM3 n=1 Tax=Cavia porcellus TaxID=10141 RepID=UPI002FE2E5C2